MMWFKRALMSGMVAVVAIALMSCERTITLVEPSTEPLTCAECHEASDLITGIEMQWADSGHGTGESYARGTSASCAGCHSGGAFSERIAAGLDPTEVEEGDPDPTRQNCRTCHMIHEAYTMQDFALETEEPVDLYALEGVTFDGGAGNLCVNCHQPRRAIPDPVGGVISGISSHWGPHHGPQSAMLLGIGGAGGVEVEGVPGGHYGAVTNTCVDCHMGENRDHHFEPELSTCQDCHPSAGSFDVGRVQTVVDSLVNELGERLLALDLIDENGPDGHAIVSEAPEDHAIALWNWIYVAHEDHSHGVHNPDYAKALLEDSLARLE